MKHLRQHLEQAKQNLGHAITAQNTLAANPNTPPALLECANTEVERTFSLANIAHWQLQKAEVEWNLSQAEKSLGGEGGEQ